MSAPRLLQYSACLVSKKFTRTLLRLESYLKSLTRKTYIPKKLYMQSNQID